MSSVKNELYVLPAIVLGHTIRKFSCEKEMIMIVGEYVGEKSREALRRVGFQVREYPAFDCRHLSKGYGFGYFADIPGAPMKLYCWNNTQFDTVIYVDSDVMLLSSIDELFTMFELTENEMAGSYCTRPGQVDPCFNSGLVVLRPSTRIFDGIMKTWNHIQDTVGCVDDQSFLFHYFSLEGRNFHLFPYAYNVRRESYHPMKVYHPAGYKPKKPWLVSVSREEAKNIPILNFPDDMYKVWWFQVYEALQTYGLESWYTEWSKVAHARE